MYEWPKKAEAIFIDSRFMFPLGNRRVVRLVALPVTKASVGNLSFG